MDGWQFLRDLHDFLVAWLGWPTFHEAEHLRRAVAIRDEGLKVSDETIRKLVESGDDFRLAALREARQAETEARHLGVLNKALAKIGNRHAQRIRELEADLAGERRRFEELSEEYEKRFR